jgi:two-component system phosphate regulon sensor histidine kinase PhoR
MKKLRFVALLPALIALPSFFNHSSSFTGQGILMSPSTAFGLAGLSIIWFVYFSGYKYGRRIMLIEGLLSLPVTTFIVGSYIWDFDFPFMKYLRPVNASAFMLNLSIIFAACFLIQVLCYWLPRTRLYVNALLAVILFITILSISGHLYHIDQIVTARLLMPIPTVAIIGFMVLSLAIFAHVNHMSHLYLNKKILGSFLLMLIAIIAANIVVYRNFNDTVKLAIRVNTTHQTLTAIYNADLYLASAASDAHAYELTGNPQSPITYQKDKQIYLTTIKQVEANISPADTNTYLAVQQVVNLGQKILATTNSMVAQGQHHTAAPQVQTDSDRLLNSYVNQMFQQVKALGASYTNELNRLFTEEGYSGRGIVTGVSVASALSVLLIIFTPLFIRQTIEQLSITQERLRKSFRQLFEENSRVEAILTSIGDGIFAVDDHGNITIFNHAAEQLTGLDASIVIGKPYDSILHFASTDTTGHIQTNFVAKALMGTSSQIDHHLTLAHKAGHPLDIQISASPVRSHQSTVAGAIVVFRDRTSEQALENAKDEFVSLASHQLRTPATATKQFLAMFLEGYAGKVSDQQRMFLQQAYDNNELGINIIEDLLNITRLESDRFKVIKEKIELTDFLKRTAEQHQPYAKRNEQIIHLTLPHKHIYIETDPSLLGMAVDNLVTNALKYSPEKSAITISLTEKPHTAIVVSDSGIGIQKEDMKKIFERFTRLEDPQKQHVSGTGIGLYLVKKIIKMLHAKIKVESDYGKGSTFTLEFKTLE